MLFNSLTFFAFFAVVWVLYLNLRHRWQNHLLLLASYVFCGWWDWRFLGLMAFPTAVNYYAAIRIQESSDERGRRTWTLIASVIWPGRRDFSMWIRTALSPRSTSRTA